MWRFFEKPWRASVSMHLPAKLFRFSLFLFYFFLTLCWCFEQELMKTPSLNFWGAAPTSRGCPWLQPIKLPMGRWDLLCFTSWGRREPASPPPPHTAFFSLRLLGFGPWHEIWADWKLWEAGAGHVDGSFLLWRRWTQRSHKGWYVHILVFAAISLVVIMSQPLSHSDS